MYEKIKSEIKQDYYQQHFSNDGQRFLAWYIRNIHSLDINQTKYAITDGTDDKQIDAIVIDEDNSKAYIIQGKFIGTSVVDATPLREVLSSWVQLKDLVRLQETANSKLKQRLNDLSSAFDDEYDVEFELVTTSHLTESAMRDLGIFQQQLAESEELSASLNLVDSTEIQRRYELALERESPLLKHTLTLEPGKYMKLNVAETNIVLTAIPLKECLKFPGIKDGTLFRKNVRQSLGLNNRVNKQIKNTIYSDRNKDFFFFHNGITAICNNMEFSEDNTISLNGISVVNGCQSLTTILSCSEKVKELDDSYIMFRFYEIPQRDRADKISISTNTQSTVKPRDLRSNDKRVLSLKKTFEQRYSQGYFITKRGEEPPVGKDKANVIDLANLGKYLMTWHSQRPNMAYSETKIFDKYFEQLFKRDYKPENVQALNFWAQKIYEGWIPNNPWGLNETLLAMKAYAPFHQLYAISMCFSVVNNRTDRVPAPYACYEKALADGVVEQVVSIAASCLNTALTAAANELQQGNKVFSPQNWIKTKTCLSGINAAINQYFMMLPSMPGGKEISQNLKNSLTLSPEVFEYRWAAD